MHPVAIKILVLEKLRTPGTLDHHLDLPTSQATSQHHSIQFAGWALAATTSIKQIALYQRGFEYPGFELRKVPLDVPRPDVLAAFPNASRDQPPLPGFRFEAAFLAHNQTLDCTLAAILSDETCIPLYHLTAKTGTLTSQALTHRPLLLTSLGRSGSTYVLGLLSRHPKILAHNPHAFDPRIASYWASVFATLGQPGSFLQQVLPMNLADPQWFLDAPTSPASAFPDQGIMTLLAHDGVNALADFALSRIDAFYKHIAVMQNRPDGSAKFFIEKCSVRPARNMIKNLCPDAGEILLVRDFRDALCSILAFNKKRGYLAFGRETVSSDVEYVEHLAQIANRIVTIHREQAANVQLLRYEHLVKSPRETLARLLSALQLDSSDAIISAMLATPDVKLLAGHRTTDDPAASINRWKSDLPPELKAACKQHLDPALKALGYDPT